MLHTAITLSWLLLPLSVGSFSPFHSSSRTHRQLPCDGSQGASRRRTIVTDLRMSTSAKGVKESISTQSPSSSATMSTAQPKPDTKLDMPWSDIQKYALSDNLPKFTVIIPSSGPSKQYAMWRTLTREVPELAGYPIPFLMQMHQQQAKDGLETPGVLPMVDDFEFASNGGITGRAYGLPGIADGTRINTPSLVNVESTVLMGYVTTAKEDGQIGFSYELGSCASSSVYSLDGSERSAALLSARRVMIEGMMASGVSSSKEFASVAKDAVASGSGLLTDAEANRDLAYLGGATALLLASATAIGMLSHHLTVNVFWV